MALKVSGRIYRTSSPSRDICNPLRGVAMQARIFRMAEISKRLEDVTSQLREQQNLASQMGSRHRAFFLLLSHGLRVYRWIADQRRLLQK
jgi:hypothetical protein